VFLSTGWTLKLLAVLNYSIFLPIRQGYQKKNEDRGRPGIWWTWFESVSSQGWSFSVHVFEKEGTYRNTNGKFEFCLLFPDVWKMLLLTDPIP